MISINEGFKSVSDDNVLFRGYARLVGVRDDYAYLISQPVDSEEKKQAPHDDENSAAETAPPEGQPPSPANKLLSVAKQAISEFNRKRIKRLLLKTPFKVPVDELIFALRQGMIRGGQVFYSDVPVSRNDLSEAALRMLDERLLIMGPIIKEEEILYDENLRMRLFREHALLNRIHERKIRRIWYEYLWGGQTELALAPALHYRGAPGSVQTSGLKRGRRPADGGAGSCSIPIYVFRDVMLKGIERFVKASNTINKAYVDFSKAYFSAGCKAAPGGRLTDILLPQSERPTRRQFRYLYFITKGPRDESPAWSRRREPERQLLSRARKGLRGPGAKFELDSSKQQIQLASVLDRSLVGSPSIYLVTDVWSGMIVGYAISFENFGWPLARAALFNCFQPKEATFKRLGLDYTEADWPCHHLPKLIMGDRGELAGKKADSIPELGIVLQNAPAYSPKSKGKIESIIKSIKYGGLRHLDGAYVKGHGRGESDGKNEAVLNIREFERRFVEEIIRLNDDPAPSEHVPPEMIREGADSISHVQLYSWGIENRYAETRLMDAQHVMTYLLTPGKASITPRGISFGGMTFTNPTLLEGLYHLRAVKTKRHRIEIRYDEHSVKWIWFRNIITNEWEAAENDNEEINEFDPGFYDHGKFRKLVDGMWQDTLDESNHQRGEVDRSFRKTLQNARREARELNSGVSRSTKKSGLNERRTREKGILKAQKNSSGNGSSGRLGRTEPVKPDSEASSEKRDRQKTFIELKKEVMNEKS
jgi:hypothetical protein